MQPRKDYEDYLRFVKDNHPPPMTETSIDRDSVEEAPAHAKTPMPNKNISLTAEGFESLRKDATAIEKPKLPVPKNRTMSNFRNGREMRTLNPFSTAKKSIMDGKLESLSYKNSVEYSKIFPKEP